MTQIEFVGYSAVHPSDFIYDVPNAVSYTHLTLPTTERV